MSEGAGCILNTYLVLYGKMHPLVFVLLALSIPEICSLGLSGIISVVLFCTVKAEKWEDKGMEWLEMAKAVNIYRRLQDLKLFFHVKRSDLVL